MSFGPFFRSPFTDLTGSLVNHQQYDKCGEREMNMMDCLEAYGMQRGVKKCKDLMDDFQECVGMQKQLMRFHVSLTIVYGLILNKSVIFFQAMRMERQRQYLFGDRKKSEHYAEPPRVDSY